MDQHLTIVDHPLVQHKLTLMRDTATSTAVFRQLLREISQLLAYEVTRNLPMSTRQIETPSGAANRHKKRMSLAPACFNKSIAATDELPVANIGSTAMVRRSPNPWGTLK